MKGAKDYLKVNWPYGDGEDNRAEKDLNMKKLIQCTTIR